MSCTFVITRGSREGQACGKQANEGAEWCTSHIKASKKISASLRSAIWLNAYKRLLPCWCCGKDKVSPFDFECGHIVAADKGGERSESNLRPICSLCNKSMGTKDMRDFARDSKFTNSPVLQEFTEPRAAPILPDITHHSQFHSQPIDDSKEVSQEFVFVALSESKASPGCQWKLLGGPRKGESCGAKATLESEYCSKHKAKLCLAVEQAEQSSGKHKDKQPVEQGHAALACQWKLTKGARKDELCGKNATEGSKFCSKHTA